jgi:N-acetylneuraminic acid mutarotase
MSNKDFQNGFALGLASGGIVESGGASLNIAYGDTAPEDTSKLWIKANEPDKITFKKEVEGAESVTLLDEYLPEAYYNMGCASVGTKIYLFGGYDGSSRKNVIRVFDVETRTMATLSVTLPSVRQGVSCVSLGSKIYLFGGEKTKSSTGYLSEICVFDTETETIITLSATLPGQCSEMACARVGTKIYLFGGRNYNKSKQDIYMFDTETETVTTLSKQLPATRAYMSCATIGTKIYLFGGYSAYSSSEMYDTIYRFDTETEVIETLDATLPTACGRMGSAIIGTKIYLFGGTNLDTINVFDTETETIETLNTTLTEPSDSMGCAAIGNRIYLFGGNKLNTITKFTLTSPLSQGNIELQTSFLNNVFKLINTDTAQVEMGVENVYIGNENNEAELCEAYLHNGIEWAVIE